MTGPPARSSRPRVRRGVDRRARRALAIAASVAVVAVVYALILPAISRYGAVWRELRTLSPAWGAALAALVSLNVTTSCLPWKVVAPQLRCLAVLRITQASTALITVVPGGAPTGMALSFSMLRSKGLDARAAASTVALTGLWSQLSTLAFPVVAIALIAATGHVPRPVAWTAAASVALVAVGVALVAAALGSSARARRLGDGARAAAAYGLRLLRRDPPSWDGDAVVRLRANALRTVRRRGPALTLATLANQLPGFVILDLSLRAVGIGLGQLSVAQTFTAWSVGRLIESLPSTPGGIGFVELGMVGTLAAFGAPHAPLVAGVLLYRALVVVPTLALGAAAAFTLGPWR